MDLRIERFLSPTTAEGPGSRFALWVQGCSLHCPGCCTPKLFDPRGGHSVSVESLEQTLATASDDIEGVTFLGGEPFEQALPLAELARHARALRLSVMVFSGYTLEELRARHDEGVDALLEQTDLLVDGRYDAALPERERRWAGSRNQRFHFFTNAYSPGIEQVGSDEAQRQIDIHVRADGTVEINGWPDRWSPLR